MEFIEKSHSKMDERSKNCPKEKIELHFYQDLQYDLGAKNNTCFMMAVGLAGAQWDGPGTQHGKIVQ